MKRVLPTCTHAWGRNAVLVATVACGVVADTAAAQSCTWGGTSTVPAPVVSYLRAQPNLLKHPGRLAVDAEDNLYILEPAAGRVVVRDVAGGFVATHEGLRSPVALAIGPGGLIYVAEAELGRVAIFTPGWKPLGFLGVGNGQFQQPTDLAVDPDPLQANVYVTDGATHRVEVFAPTGSALMSFGGLGSGPGAFNFPSAIYVSAAGLVYVGDQNNDRVQVFDRLGTWLRCFGSRSTAFSRRFGRIQAIGGDRSGRIYVADGFQGRVQAFDAQGVLLSTVASFGERPGDLKTPAGLAFDGRNRLFVGSLNAGRIEAYGLDSFTDPHGLLARVVVQPRRPRLGTNNVLTLSIELPGADPATVEVASLRANGAPPISTSSTVRDTDGDSLPELIVKFRAHLALAGLPAGSASILVTGETSTGMPLEGVGSVELLPAY